MSDLLLHLVGLIFAIMVWAITSRSTRQRLQCIEANALLVEADSIGTVDSSTQKLKSDSRTTYLVGSLGALLFVAMSCLAGLTSIHHLVMHGGVGGSVGLLVATRMRVVRARRAVEQVEFHLPLAMERVVMGVAAGLDIVPAMIESSRDLNDPISVMFRKIAELSDRGLSISEAFDMVGREAQISSVRHSFVHLSLAHKEGGELIRPLRELSDATQLSYQERVEEQIAQLPAKGVLPLVVTFTGLIVCFITVPLIQVSTLTQRVSQEALQ